MPIFDYDNRDALGSVISVDTATVIVRVDDIEKLKSIQVNRLAVLRSSRPGQHLVGIVTRITRKADSNPVIAEDYAETPLPENNLVRVTLIGTLLDRDGVDENVFRRTLETVPEIEASCFALEGVRLTAFMSVISSVANEGPKLEIGRFTLDDEATAYLNGNKFFQRHAMIVGSTGSGKSWTVAQLLEQIERLPQANAIVFDLHGEYKPLEGAGFRHLRVAGPADIGTGTGISDGVLYLPYWLLGYESLVSLFVDRSDQNAPNQSMMMMKCISDGKRKTLQKGDHDDILANFTIDSPVPFSIDDVITELKRLDSERVPGARAGTEKNGPFADKLSRMIGRLESKRFDRRLGFLFQPPEASAEMTWLAEIATQLLGGTGMQRSEHGGVKIIDLSEVPSDILPLTISVLADMIFTANQWTTRENRHPISILCDEAHLYISERSGNNAGDAVAANIFERIAKEGRKYGIGLVVISQRPSEVNRTVLSQCNNVIAMRLTNGDDQSVIRRLLPDSLGGFGDLLPVLDTGEALVVGDATLLPTRVRINEPSRKPDSGTIDFWDEWCNEASKPSPEGAIEAWRRQSQRI